MDFLLTYREHSLELIELSNTYIIYRTSTLIISDMTKHPYYLKLLIVLIFSMSFQL